MNSKRDTGVIVAMVLVLNVTAWVFTPFDPVFVAVTAPVCAVMVGAWLWVFRKRLTPGVMVNLLDAQGMLAANKQLRRYRPWMWGPLRRQWVYEIHMIEFPVAAVGTYRWKDRQIRYMEKHMSHCCGVFDGQRCPSHEEQHDA